MTVVHNRGKKVGDKQVARKIIFPRAVDANGQPLREKDGKQIQVEILLPNASKDVTDWQLKHLLEHFPNEIINIEDIKNMQDQFKPAPPEKPREGYVAPDEVNALVEKRVQEELAKRAGGNGGEHEGETREQLIARIDSMDRPDLIALLEREKLDIDHKKYKAPGALKAAILSGIENKNAAASEGTEEAA